MDVGCGFATFFFCSSPDAGLLIVSIENCLDWSVGGGIYILEGELGWESSSNALNFSKDFRLSDEWVLARLCAVCFF